jgi:FtsH-binding integral membrane protein
MIAVALARPSERALFIRRTYSHLAGAVGAFLVVEYALFQSGFAQAMARLAFSSGFAWLMILGGFSLLGWFARSLATNTSIETQYMGLGIYVVGEAIIFAPLILIGVAIGGSEVLATAGIITGCLFVGLSAIALTTRRDFFFLRGVLTVGGFVALGLIICSAIFGFSLGLLFSVIMVAFASAAILYDTSNIMHRYAVDQHVAASLQLFASVALLFWYVLQILIALNSRR